MRFTCTWSLYLSLCLCRVVVFLLYNTLLLSENTNLLFVTRFQQISLVHSCGDGACCPLQTSSLSVEVALTLTNGQLVCDCSDVETTIVCLNQMLS